MAVIVPPLRPQSNVDVANAVRGSSSNSYREHVPVATQANVQQTLQEMWDYQPNRNEFINALVNRIGLTLARNAIWTNPLAVFKRGMLSFGDTIEEIAVGLAQAHTYDIDRDYLEKAIFGQEPNEVQSSFHKINRAEYFKVTVNESNLQRAFLSETGLWEFTASLMASATNADELNEFLTTTALFMEYHRMNGFFKVNVPNIIDSNSDGADSRAFLRTVRAYAATLPFISRHYNAAKLPVFANKDELILIMTPQGQAATDVEALAAAFNIDKADMPTRVVIVPQENIGIPGVQAILTTSDFFIIADTLIETREAPNPVGLYTNYFFHHQEIISASRFVPAILFWTGESDTIEEIETPVTGVGAIEVADGTSGTTVTALERGKVYVAHAEATTDGLNDGVRYELVSKATGPLSPRTYLSQTGVLSISKDESSTVLTINAYALDSDEPQLFATADYNVTGQRIHLWPLDVDEDSDNDGLYEVVPAVPAHDGATVTIPEVEGVQYKQAGTNVTKGNKTISASTVFTAVAKTGYELKAGAPASWTYAP